MTPQLVAVDHFAGTGWGVACRWLGIREYGVEIMPEAIRTRRAVGFRTIYRDVWSGLMHPWLVPWHELFIASPPCQTFSVAGAGSGRRALDQVLKLIGSGAWKNPAALYAAGADLGDDRTALVLTPLAHIWANRPRLVALEQVPTVLPVWEAIADVLRGLGYSVWTGNLQAEMYGVPQTRKRAILMARLDGPVAPPVPTHSRYYSRTPSKLDPGVLKWVSMAEALGVDGFDLVGNQVPRGRERGDYHSRPSGAPAQTITGQSRSWALQRRGLASRPAPTITGGGTETGGAEPIAKLDRYTSSPDWVGDKARLSPHEAAVLQSYPNIVYRNGNQANAAKRALDEPAPTIHFGARSNKVEWIGADIAADPKASGIRVTTSEAAMLQSYPLIAMRPELAAWRWIDAPATTVAGDPRITAREHHYHGEQSATALKLKPSEAARFQSFPAPFPFQGGRGKQFLQIGNAVPPLLAHAILSSLISEPRANVPQPADRSRWESVFANYGEAA